MSTVVGFRRRWVFLWHPLQRSHRRPTAPNMAPISGVRRMHSCRADLHSAGAVFDVLAFAESVLRLLLGVVATVTNIPTPSGIEPRLAVRRPLTLPEIKPTPIRHGTRTNPASFFSQTRKYAPRVSLLAACCTLFSIRIHRQSRTKDPTSTSTRRTSRNGPCICPQLAGIELTAEASRFIVMQFCCAVLCSCRVCPCTVVDVYL
jgi:hypothetical protein